MLAVYYNRLFLLLPSNRKGAKSGSTAFGHDTEPPLDHTILTAWTNLYPVAKPRNCSGKPWNRPGHRFVWRVATAYVRTMRALTASVRLARHGLSEQLRSHPRHRVDHVLIVRERIIRSFKRRVLLPCFQLVMGDGR